MKAGTNTARIRRKNGTGIGLAGIALPWFAAWL